MSQMIDDPIDPKKIERAAIQRGAKLGTSVLYFEEVGSTNDETAKRAISGAAHGLVVIADHQLSGRGRTGRTWHSPAGQNLYLSVLLRPQHPLDRIAPITLVLGLAVSDLAADLLDIHRVGLKWPNDVLVGSRKLAGILVDAASVDGRVEYLVVGIGLNVHQIDFDPAIASIATSLAKEGAENLNRTHLASRLLSTLETRLEQFDSQGLQELICEIRARDITLGRPVKTEGRHGIARGIADDGQLRVSFEDGSTTLVHAGEVELTVYGT
jgi:BirA family biotin operon repressor/biotin-[acetyl-CoA-carboxylase] ligase